MTEEIYRTKHPKYRWGLVHPRGGRIEVYETKRAAIEALAWFKKWYPKEPAR